MSRQHSPTSDPTALAADDYARHKAEFLALLDLDATARVQRLAALDGEAPALAATLRHQLEAALRPNALLDRAGRKAEPPQLAPYRLLAELGRGGMGVVWLAERSLGDARQLVAIKQIAHHAWNDEDSKRFQRERRILAALDHPNIAALVDGGTDAGGAPYLATQYVEGERIDHWCATHALDVRARVKLLRQVASAVAYAHRKLVVHRDLKPANILVTRDGTPKLLDFGIARALAEEAVTTDGPSQMTLRYAAPEQVVGDTQVGVGTDVYALGVLLYELVALDSPYGDAAGAPALVHAILHVEPPPPSRAPRALPGIDGDLDAIARRTLRKAPAERYASAEAFADDLDRWLARRPVAAREGERGYRARKFVRRHWGPLAVALASVVAIVGFIAYDLRTTQARLAEVERERDKAQALATYFSRLFEGANPADTERGDVTARELLERSVAKLEADATQSPETRAALLLAAGDALSYLGDATQALRAHTAGLASLQQSGIDDAELEAALLSEVASSRYRMRDLDGARAAIEASLALFEEGRAHDADRRLTARQQAAMYAEERGDPIAARAAYLQIVAETEPLQADPKMLESYLAAQTNVALTDNPTDPAATAARIGEALAVAKRNGFERPASLLPMRAYRGAALIDANRVAEAVVDLRDTLAAARAYYGPRDQWLDIIVASAARAELLGGDPRRGLALFDEVARFRAEQFGAESALARRAREDRALGSIVVGDYDDAVARLDPALAAIDANGEAEKAYARHLRAGRAYAAARAAATGNPVDAALLDALDAALAADDGWRGWKRWVADDWRAWAAAQRAR